MRFRKDILNPLRHQELESFERSLSEKRGMKFNMISEGKAVSGAFRETLRLSSGRFAVLDDGLGFSLVPWTPSLEKFRDRHVYGMTRSDGGIDWRRERERGLGR
ncbi:MAG: DUF3363 domain-containing protein [Methylocystis sp.]